MSLIRWEGPRGSSAWDPFRELPLLQRQMNGLIESFFGKDQDPLLPKEVQGWSPACEVAETDQELTLTAELPGVDEKDIRIEHSNGRLSIRGERRAEAKQDDKDRKIHRSERFYGSFERSLLLPDSVDAARISARHDKGVLTVRLPKKAADKPTAIPVGKG